MKRKAAARDEAPDGDDAPDEAFDEEEATRQAKRMKSEELRSALEAAGVEDTEGNKPALVERLVAAKKRAAAGDNDDAEAAPAAFDEEDATRLAKRMKVEELRAALEAAGAEDTEGTKPVLVEQGNAINALIQQRMASAIDDEKARGAEAVAAAAAVEGAEQTKSGLVIEHVKEGVGPFPTAASTVSVHYVGTLIDGTVFDSSRARGGPAQFAVKQVIKGWQEALQLMQEGGTAKLTIPADIAYGDGGSPPNIPGGGTICFEVELLKVLTGGVGGLIL